VTMLTVPEPSPTAAATRLPERTFMMSPPLDRPLWTKPALSAPQEPHPRAPVRACARVRILPPSSGPWHRRGASCRLTCERRVNTRRRPPVAPTICRRTLDLPNRRSSRGRGRGRGRVDRATPSEERTAVDPHHSDHASALVSAGPRQRAPCSSVRGAATGEHRQDLRTPLGSSAATPSPPPSLPP
jgi:hypothetical protein